MLILTLLLGFVSFTTSLYLYCAWKDLNLRILHQEQERILLQKSIIKILPEICDHMKFIAKWITAQREIEQVMPLAETKKKTKK